MENRPSLAVAIRPLTENDVALIYAFFTSFSSQTRLFFTLHAPFAAALAPSSLPD